MLNQFSRTELLLGKEAMEKLGHSRVAVFGVGGVGGYVCEALVRSGVGAFDLIDDDKVCLTNLNRQIIATRKTVGKYKAEVKSIRKQMYGSISAFSCRRMRMIFRLANMIILWMRWIPLLQKSSLS